MNSEVVYFLICMLIPRLFLQWKDQSENLIRENLVSFLCELFLLSPLFSVDSILYILVYLLYFHLLVTALEFNGRTYLFEACSTVHFSADYCRIFVWHGAGESPFQHVCDKVSIGIFPG